MKSLIRPLVLNLLFLSLFILCDPSPASLYAKPENKSTDALFKLGKQYYTQGNYKEAADEFQKCLLARPERQDYQKYLLLAERSLELKDKAIDYALEKSKAIEAPENKKASSKEIIPPIEKGAWTVPKGKLYIESYNKYYWHNAQFDSSGHKLPWNYDGHYYEFRTELKFEYGLSDNLNALLYLPFKEAKWEDDFAKYTKRGLADFWTGLKYKLAQDPVVTSLQGRIKIPGNYNKRSIPSLGTRQMDYELKVLLAKSLYPFFNGYTKLESGFRWRTHAPTNEVPYFFELGYNLTEFLVLKGTIDGIKGIKDTGTLLEDYTKWDLSTIWKIKNYAVEVGYGETFAGKNSSVGKEIVLSFSTQL